MSAVRRVVTGREKPRADRTHRPHVMPTPRPPRGQPVPQPGDAGKRLGNRRAAARRGKPCGVRETGRLRQARSPRAAELHPRRGEHLRGGARRIRGVRGCVAGSLQRDHEVAAEKGVEINQGTRGAPRDAGREDPVRVAAVAQHTARGVRPGSDRGDRTAARARGVHGPRVVLQTPYQPFDSADKHVITGHIAALSAELPHLLIVPGSIL